MICAAFVGLVVLRCVACVYGWCLVVWVLVLLVLRAVGGWCFSLLCCIGWFWVFAVCWVRWVCLVASVIWCWLLLVVVIVIDCW